MPDYPTGVPVPGAASYQSPLLDFSAIGNLPQTYDEADKASAARDVRNAFRNGIPKVEGTTIPDYGKMADTLAKARAPVSDVVSLANQGIGWDIFRQSGVPGGPGAPAAPGPQSSGAPAGGDYYSKTAAVESGNKPTATSPTSSSSGLYGFTAGTRADIASRYGIDPSDEQGLIKAFTADNAKQLTGYNITPTDRNLRLAHFLGANGAAAFIEGMKGAPNAPAYTLASQDAVRANQSMFFNKDGTPKSAAGFYGSVTGGFTDSTGTATAALGGTVQPGQNAPAGPQVAQTGRTDVQPIDVTAPAGAPQVPREGVPQKIAPYNQPGAQTPASALVPPQWVGHEQQYADWLNKRAQAMALIPGGMGKVESERLANQAKTITDALAEGAKLTPTQKDYQSDKRPGETMADYGARVAGTKKQAEDDVTAYQKRYTSIQALGEQAKTGIQKAMLGSRLIEDSNFYSGPFEPTSRTFKQFASVLGADPNRAMPQEAFNKIVNDLLQEQVKAMGQSGVGRVLQSEVNIMRQAIASLGVTPATNQLLLEMVRRTYEKSMDIAKIAREFKPTTPGTYNQDLDQKINDYLDRKPMFKQEEYNDPRLIAPPHFKNAEAAKAAGLAPGTPVLIDGLSGIRMTK